jgi:WD40 repeat protein
MSYDAFISYARADKIFVRSFHDALVRRERKVWVDSADIPALDPDWIATVFGAIEASDTFVFIMSPASVASSVCAQEVAHAARHGKRLAVIVHRAVDDETVKERLPGLMTPQWFFLWADDEFERSVDRLLDALNTDPDHVKAHTRLYVRAREWEARGDDGALLRGAGLREAERWLETGTGRIPPPTALHERYVRASRKGSARGQAQQLAMDAELALTGQDLTLSVLLATESHRLAPSPQSERVLRHGLRLPRLAFSMPDGRGGSTVELSSDGTRVAIARGPQVQVLAIPSGREIAVLGHENVSVMQFSPSGRLLTTFADDSTDSLFGAGWVRVWKLADAGKVAEAWHSGRVLSLAYAHNERYVTAGGLNEIATVLDLEAGQAVRLAHRDAVVEAFAFTQDDRLLATGQAGATRTARGWRITSNDIYMWSVPRWRRQTRIKDVGEVDLLAFTENGKYLLGHTGKGNLRVWSQRHRLGMTVWREVGVVEHGKAVNDIALHPYFWWIFATACDDGVVRIVQAMQNGNQIRVGESYRLVHDGPVTSVAFIPGDERGNRESTIVAAGGRDRTAREWNGNVELMRAAHPTAVRRVRYSADRRFLVACTDGGGVFVWESNHDQPAPETIPIEPLLDELGRRVTRNLSMEEWRRHLGDEPYRQTYATVPAGDVSLAKGTL